MRFTASKAALRKACQYWLDPSVALPEREPTASSIEGTRVHNLIENELIPRPNEDASKLDPAVLTARKYLKAYAGGRPFSQEDALALEWDGTVKWLGAGREKYASQPDGTFAAAGTSDLIVHLGQDEWLVTDWKNGEHGSAKAEEQLRLLAAMQMEYVKARKVHMHALWLQGDGTPVDYGTLTRMEARGILLDARGGVAPTLPTPQPGDHCSAFYCPLDGLCPAFAKTAELIPASSLVRHSKVNPMMAPIADELTARDAVAILDEVESVVKAKREELRAFIKKNGGELDMGNGQVYKPVKCKGREGFDKAGAMALLGRLKADKEEVAALLKLGAPYDQWRLVGSKDKE
jgi:hypothetical protein